MPELDEVIETLKEIANRYVDVYDATGMSLRECYNLFGEPENIKLFCS